MSVNGNGNVAALCEALELCKHELCEMCRRHNPGETCVNGCETIIRAKTALAANHQPKPDPDWAEICAKCIDGEIEPEECEYYGEPNGCNSPIYGQHPQSTPVGNTAAMREALRTLRQRFDNNVMAYQDRYFKFSGWHWHKKAAEAARWRDVFHELREACDAALAAPPRNCDMPLVVDGPADNDADKAWLIFKQHNPDAYFDVSGLLRCIDWLLAHATEGGAK